jgi:amino acid adenylation domain-containing protein
MEKIDISLYQKRFWIEWKLNPQSTSYNTPLFFEINGIVNQDALRYALHTFINHYDEGCRSHFSEEDSEVKQIISEKIELQLNIRTAASQHDTSKTKIEFINKLTNTIFDLTNAPLYQFELLILNDNHSILGLNFHHIISDAVTAGCFIHIVSGLYNSYLASGPTDNHAVLKKSADYIQFETLNYTHEQKKADLDYWSHLLKKSDLLLNIPTNNPDNIDTNQSKSVYFNLGKEVSLQLRTIAREKNSSLFVTMAALYGLLILRYCSQKTGVLNYPVNMRPPGFRDKTGCFVNNVLFNLDISEDKLFSQFLSELTAQRRLTKDHQRCSLTEIVQHLRDNGILKGQKFFNVDFYEAYLGSMPLNFNGIQVSTIQSNQHAILNDIGLAYQNTSECIELRLEYKENLFGSGFADFFITQYNLLIEKFISNTDFTLYGFPLITDVESDKIQNNWNATQSDYLDTKSICQLFEEQAELHPDKIAAKLEKNTLTYKQLNERANQLAHYLKKCDIRHEEAIGLYSERSLEMLIGMIGILKAGACYIPLDPKYPENRIHHMIKDSGLKLLLATGSLLPKLDLSNLNLIQLDNNKINSSATDNLAPIKNLASAAYVIYTSGSTGNPKGVVVNHQSLLNHNLFAKQCYKITPLDSVLQFSSINFDISIEEIFPTLISGASITLYPDKKGLSIKVLEELIAEEHISVLNLPTAFWHIWTNELTPASITHLTKLRLVIVGGEQADYATLMKWSNLVNDKIDWINTYGPTEATVISSTWQYSSKNLNELNTKKIPIGSPISNTQLYITDAHLNLLPVGLTGELYIAGDNLARGYLNNPQMTASQFIPNPFSHLPGSRLYKTGDLAKYSHDGVIEYIGRIDDQVKIRGFRVEPGEVENTLKQHHCISQAIITVVSRAQNDYYLAAYIVLNDKNATSVNDLKSYASLHLPEYMVPSYFIILDKLPLTPNGKVDKSALPQPDVNTASINPFITPKSHIEKQITEIWQEVLKLEKISTEDNFFDLGGHSLLILKIHAQMEKILKMNIPVVNLFQFPTVKSLAEFISSQGTHTPVEQQSNLNAQKQRTAFERQRQLMKQRKQNERI